MQSRKARFTGMTLIEVLVVAGIVAALLGVLVPVVSRARQHAHRTSCATNLRTLGQAFVSYASDYRGWVPRRARYHGNQSPVWVVVIARQLRSRGIVEWRDLEGLSPLQCPSHPTAGLPTAFVLNAFAMETMPDWKPSPPVQLSGVRASSSLPWLLETPDLFKTYANIFDDIFFEPEHTVFSPEHLPGGRTPRMNFSRHLGGTSNVLFADGHVDLMRGSGPEFKQFDDMIRNRNW